MLFVLGCLTSISLPPFNLFIINFFTFSIFFSFLFKKLDNQKNKITYFLYGWLFGFGYFLSNLYWITISLTFDANFSFLIPLALIFIHGFLHLLGYDHIKDKDYKIMLQAENKIFKSISKILN